MKEWKWLALAAGVLALAVPGHATIQQQQRPSFTITLNLPGQPSVPLSPVMTLSLQQVGSDRGGSQYTLTFTEYGDGSNFWQEVQHTIQAHQDVGAVIQFSALNNNNPNDSNNPYSQTITLDQAVSVQRQASCDSGFDTLGDLGLEQVTLVFRTLSFVPPEGPDGGQAISH